MTIPFFDSLSKKALSDPDGTCFDLYGSSGLERTLTFSQTLDGVARTAQMFKEIGLGTGDIVLIFAQHSEGMFLAFFGAVWMGAIPAFMPPPSAKQEVKAWAATHTKLIERIQPRVVVSEPSCLGHVQALGADVLSTEEIENYKSSVRSEAIDVDLDSIAFLQHSSGTTGLKKGVMVTHRQLYSQLDVYGRALGISDNANVISWLPVYHDMGLIAATLLPVYFGVPVRLIDTFAWLSNPGSVISLLEKFPNGYCWLPNFAFNYLAKRTKLDLSTTALNGVRSIINCSEPCKHGDIKAFLTRFEPHGLKQEAVQVCYAAAEYVFAMTQTAQNSKIDGLLVDGDILETEGRVVPANDVAVRTKTILPVGVPVDGIEIRIGDNQSDGVVGEVIVRGPSMCSGYFRNETMTNTKFVDGWYMTGDLGFKYENLFYITGRIDDLIIVRGKNLYAHDIEELASSIAGVKPGRTSAFGIDDKNGTQQLILVVESTGEVQPRSLKIEISDHINASLGIVPTEIVVVHPNSLFKTTSGKISRSANRKNYLDKTLNIVALSQSLSG